MRKTREPFYGEIVITNKKIIFFLPVSDRIETSTYNDVFEAVKHQIDAGFYSRYILRSQEFAKKNTTKRMDQILLLRDYFYRFPSFLRSEFPADADKFMTNHFSRLIEGILLAPTLKRRSELKAQLDWILEAREGSKSAKKDISVNIFI
jgi:hypothetical protein